MQHKVKAQIEQIQEQVNKQLDSAKVEGIRILKELGANVEGEKLEILEQQYERLASQKYSNSKYNMPTDSEALPYELQQIESDPTTSALYDTNQATETGIPVTPDELKKLEKRSHL